MSRFFLSTSAVVFAAISLQAAPKKTVILDYQPNVKVSIQELLAMPGNNRIEVARMRADEFLPALEKMAFSPSEDMGTRWKSLTLAAQLKGDKSEVFLKKAIDSKEWYMRNAALLAYGEVLPKKSKAVAVKALSDKALVVRSAAVQVLARSADDRTREILWDQITNSKNFRKKQSLYIRGQILTVLAQEPSDKEGPLFLKHLRENDSRMHAPAIAGLERITSRKFGQSNDPVQKKRDLWMKWAKNSPEF